MKILDTMWITYLSEAIGIVAIKNDGGELKFYCGLGHGVDEKSDIRKIVANGGKIYPEHMISFFERMKEISATN